MVVVDAGNLLFKKAVASLDEEDFAVAQRTARGIAQAYRAMAYDAVAVSGNDLMAGADFFQATADGFPFVAANVYDQQEKLFFSAHIIKNIGPLTLGIIGLTGEVTDKDSAFIVKDWRTTLQDQIDQLENTCSMLLVLSSLSEAENIELQKDFQQVDILVTADKRGKNIQPQRAGNSLLVQSGSRGKYIGRLDITRYGDGNWSQARSRSATQPGGKIPTGKTYRPFFLVVHPVSSSDAVGLIEQELEKNK